MMVILRRSGGGRKREGGKGGERGREGDRERGRERDLILNNLTENIYLHEGDG